MRDYTFCRYKKVLGGIRTHDPQILRRALDHCAEREKKFSNKQNFSKFSITFGWRRLARKVGFGRRRCHLLSNRTAFCRFKNK